MGQPREEGNRCITFCVFKEKSCVIADAPKYSPRSLRRPYYRLCVFVILIRGPLYGADTPKQDAYYCEFYWAVSLVVRDTGTIPNFTVDRNTVAIQLGTQKFCCRLQLHYQKNVRCSKKRRMSSRATGLMVPSRVSLLLIPHTEG